LVQQRLKKMKIPAINERDFDRRALQFLRGSQSAESATKNNDSMLFVHARRSPERNLTRSGIISFTVIFSRVMRGVGLRIPGLFVAFSVLFAKAWPNAYSKS